MKKVSLTFDNGPTPGITDHVLDTLRDFGVRATFFLVGEKLEVPEGRRLAERAVAEGHRIGNHSYGHGAPLGLREEAGAAADEILRMHRLLGDLAGEVPLYRPNGRGSTGPHLFNREAIDTLSTLGASVTLWTSIPRDRAAVVDKADAWLNDARQAVLDAEWTVMVLHDRPSGFTAPSPMDFLPDFLRWASDRVEFRLDFPPDCVPMVRGRPQPELALYVATP